MSTVKLDIQKGLQLRQDRVGRQYERIALVSGLTGDAQLRIAAALDHAEMPQLGAALTGINFVTLEERIAQAITADIVEVRLIYRWGSHKVAANEIDIEVGASLVQLVTNYDRHGNLMFTEYGGETQVGTVTVLWAEHDLILTRVESESPRNKSVEFSGTVNKFQWLGNPPRTWMCAIRGRSTDSGNTWEVVYQFHHKPKVKRPDESVRLGWDVEIVHKNTQTGQPQKLASGAEEAAGHKIYEVHPQMDFNALGLTIPG